jgi:hypothetical protein
MANRVYGDQIGDNSLRNPCLRNPDNFWEAIMNLVQHLSHALRNVLVRLVAMHLSRSLSLASLIALLCLIATPALAEVTPMVAAGSMHTVALKSDGTVMAWGTNGVGQLGNGTTTNRLSPVAVPGIIGAMAVAPSSC